MTYGLELRRVHVRSGEKGRVLAPATYPSSRVNRMRVALVGAALLACYSLVGCQPVDTARSQDPELTPPSSQSPASPIDGSGVGSPSPTLVGVAVQPRADELYSEARAAADARYGSVDVIRFFDPSLPEPWPKLRARIGPHPVVVSFKAAPSEILEGRHDQELMNWFNQAPRGKRTWWSYMPEPEDDIEIGSYSARAFRAAWRHVYGLATEAHNPFLHSTLTLMCFTLNPDSGRDWRDYYPGGDYVDVMAWDCYNTLSAKGLYVSPDDLFGSALGLSEHLGKPWAIAETGSVMASGDTGADRARWIAHVISYAGSKHAEFVTYFDADMAGDFRLLDRPSQRALARAIDRF